MYLVVFILLFLIVWFWCINFISFFILIYYHVKLIINVMSPVIWPSGHDGEIHTWNDETVKFQLCKYSEDYLAMLASMWIKPSPLAWKARIQTMTVNAPQWSPPSYQHLYWIKGPNFPKQPFEGAFVICHR